MVEGSPESVFWDSDWTLTLLVSSPVEASVVVNWEGPAPPGLTLRRVVEDVSYEGQEVRRSISWTWRVGTAHEGEVGPLRVRSAGLEGLTDPIEVRFLTPPDAPVVSTSEPELSLVSELFGHLVEAEPVREGDLVRVRVSTGDRVSWEPRPDRVVRTELREKGQVLWTGWEAHAPSGTGLTVARGNSVIFQGPLP